jgi:hypothetical protein
VVRPLTPLNPKCALSDWQDIHSDRIPDRVPVGPNHPDIAVSQEVGYEVVADTFVNEEGETGVPQLIGSPVRS